MSQCKDLLRIKLCQSRKLNYSSCFIHIFITEVKKLGLLSIILMSLIMTCIERDSKDPGKP